MAGAEPHGVWACASLVGDHTAGTSVKALALCALPGGPGRWLLLSAGSKKVLIAWELRSTAGARPAPGSCCGGGGDGSARHAPAAPPPPPLRCHWLATLAAARALRPKGSAASAHPEATSDHRYLAADVFLPDAAAAPAAAPAADAAGLDDGGGALLPPLPPVAFVLAASADAVLCLLACRLSAARPARPQPAWPLAAALQYHSAPVLCLQYLRLEAHDPTAATAAPASVVHLAFTGSTDGSVAVWDLTPAVLQYRDGSTAAAAAAAPTLRPALVLPRAHQSGVNGLSAVALSPGRVLLLTAGDDQALCAGVVQVQVQVCRGGAQCALRCHVSVPNAHASALRDVWTDGAATFSLGLDQRLRRWAIRTAVEDDGRGAAGAPAAAGGGGAAARQPELSSDGGGGIAVEEAGCAIVQVIEPASLDAAFVPGDAPAAEGGDGAAHYQLAVAGRGVQAVRWAA